MLVFVFNKPGCRENWVCNDVFKTFLLNGVGFLPGGRIFGSQNFSSLRETQKNNYPENDIKPYFAENLPDHVCELNTRILCFGIC